MLKVASVNLRMRKPNTWVDKGKKNLEPVSSTSRRGAKAAYHDECPRDFGPRISYTMSLVSDTTQSPTLCRPLSRQGGREMSAPRPYETDPFHPHSSVHISGYNQFLYICNNVPVMSPIWYDISTMYLTNAHALW